MTPLTSYNYFQPQPTFPSQQTQQMGMFGQVATQNYSPIQYVNGIDSANAFILQPNQSVILMDNNKPVFYYKQSDAAGVSTVKAYEFHEFQEKKQELDFVTRDEFNELVSKINNLQNQQSERRGGRNESSTK